MANLWFKIMEHFNSTIAANRTDSSTTEVTPSSVPADRTEVTSAKGIASSKPDYYGSFLKHLLLREGVRYEVYKDSLGYLTAGVGHLLPKDTELDVGSPVTKEDVDKWLAEDAMEAWCAAKDQMVMLGISDQLWFQGPLASVNFQLGTSWYKIHKNTWKFMCMEHWQLASNEVYDSKWFEQTPVRVKDFSKALLELEAQRYG